MNPIVPVLEPTPAAASTSNGTHEAHPVEAPAVTGALPAADESPAEIQKPAQEPDAEKADGAVTKEAPAPASDSAKEPAEKPAEETTAPAVDKPVEKPAEPLAEKPLEAPEEKAAAAPAVTSNGDVEMADATTTQEPDEEPDVEAEPPAGTKRKAEDSAETNGDNADKKAKSDEVSAPPAGETNGNGSSNGDAKKPGRPKKEKKVAVSAGRTARKTRSQGPA